MEMNGFGWHEKPRPPGSQELAEATRRYYEFTIERVRRRALHVRVELPGGQGQLQLHGAVELVQAPGRHATRRRTRTRSSTTRPRVSTGWRHEPQRRRSSARTWSCRRPPPACRCPISRCPTRTTCCSAACAFTISTGAPRACRPWSSCTAAASTPTRGTSCAPRSAGSGTAWPWTSAATARASGRPRWTTPPRATPAIVGAFVDALKLERFVLVGMSLGGVNGLAWAGRHSRRLAGLVMIDVGPEVRAEGVRKIAAFTSEATPLDSVEQYVERALSFNPRRNRELLRRSLLHNLRRMPDGRFMWKYDQRHRGRALDPAVYTRRREMLWSAVDGVTCPDARRTRRPERRLPRRGRRAPGRPLPPGTLGEDRGRGPHRAGRQPRRPARGAAKVPGRGYGLISVVARLMTNASRRSRKSTTTSANASGRSMLIAWPAPYTNTRCPAGSFSL